MELREGFIASGLGHGLVLGWVVLGGFFVPRTTDLSELSVTEVSVISHSEFSALMSPEPSVVPVAPQRPIDTPVAEPSVAPPPPTPQVEDVLRPTNPPQAPRLAVSPSPTPAPEAAIAPVVQTSPPPEPTQDPVEEQVEDTPQTAPEAATTQTVTETEPTSSPVVENSIRPSRRPAQAVVSPQSTDEQSAPDDLATAIASAVAEAQVPSAPSSTNGSLLTTTEIEVLRQAVQSCWNVGSLSSAAMRTTVTIGFSLRADGTPIAASLRLIEATGGDTAAASQSFEAGRRAILRCGRTGFDLPVEKYDFWRDIEMTFNPNEMRIR